MISLAEVIIQFVTVVDELSRELLGGIPSYGCTLRCGHRRASMYATSEAGVMWRLE